LTKRGNDSNVAVATNQDESTFTSQQKNDYVFSQNATNRTINNVSTRGFYKVNDTREEKIVLTPAIAARSAQYQSVTTVPGFYFSGLVVSEIPPNCRGKNFIVSGYDENSPNAQVIINITDSDADVTEVTALYTGTSATPKVSKDRKRFDDISSRVTATQESGKLSLVFGNGSSQTYLSTDDLVRLVIETQENTLGRNNDDSDEGDDD
jgi:hypothetical protein